MILADEYEELEKEREVFAQENKFSKTKSASPTQARVPEHKATGQETAQRTSAATPPDISGSHVTIAARSSWGAQERRGRQA